MALLPEDKKSLEASRKGLATQRRLGEVSARRVGNQRARIANVGTSGVAESVRRRLDRTRQLSKASSDTALEQQALGQSFTLSRMREGARLEALADERRFAFQDRLSKRRAKSALIGGIIGGVSGVAASAAKPGP